MSDPMSDPLPDPTSDPRIERFFAAEGPWRAELAALRRLALAAPLEEAFKWRAPVYVAAGGNVATLGGLKDCCVLSFFKGALLADPQGLLEPPGEATRSARVARLHGLAEIEAKAQALAALLEEAAANERAGRRVDLPPDDFELPDALQARIAADPAFAEAWAALTPGRRRGWALHVGRAKGAGTRVRRTEEAAPRILAGKGLHDR
ncbi:MAG: YdeI/OmpD-associated family protein [Albimonas sp.]|uniref:YdeI/OmpD-associated family protein n=1 Tax=Albimonas sp. TaxID=1872425 RepID=UPI004056A584